MECLFMKYDYLSESIYGFFLAKAFLNSKDHAIAFVVLITYFKIFYLNNKIKIKLNFFFYFNFYSYYIRKQMV